MAESPMAFASRVFIAIIFIGSGLTKLLTFEKETGGPVTPMMAPKLDHALAQIKSYTGFTIPIEHSFYPRLVLLAAVVELLGGLLFTMNFSFGAVLLMLYTVVVTPIMHNFWDEKADSIAQQNEIVHCLKNMSMVGAFMHFLATADGVPVRRKRSDYKLE